MRATSPALLLFAASCTASTTQIAIGPPPAKETSGALAGALCTGETCKCRDPGAPADGGAGAPAPGMKRFEIRFGPSPQPLWAVLPGMGVLYKSAEKADACFYVDLAPGAHPIELRASAPEGVSAAWAIHEYGAQAASWYDTFAFDCGSPGVCSFSELDDAKPRYQRSKRGVYDKCGSTRVKGLTWDTGKSPDQLHPSELVVRLELDVRKFAPTQPHGDDSCGKGRTNNPAADDDLPPEPTVVPAPAPAPPPPPPPTP